MRFDLDGERCKQYVPLARKLMLQCELLDLDTKSIIVNGFRITARRDEDQGINDRVKIVSPVGAVAAVVFPTDVYWIVSEFLPNKAGCHLLQWCTSTDPTTGICLTKINPYVMTYGGEISVAQLPIALSNCINELVRTRLAFGNASGATVMNYYTHCYGIPMLTTAIVNGLAPASSDPSFYYPYGRVHLWKGSDKFMAGTLYDNVSYATYLLQETIVDAQVDVVVSGANQVLTSNVLASQISSSYFMTDPNGILSTLVIDHCVAHKGNVPEGTNNTVAHIIVTSTYQVNNGSTPYPTYTELNMFEFVFDLVNGWAFNPGATIQLCAPADTSKPGSLAMTFAALAGSPYAHKFNQITFHDDVADKIVTWGVFDGTKTVSPQGCYIWGTPITTVDGSGYYNFDDQYAAGPIGNYIFPSKFLDQYVRPEYQLGLSRWALMLRQFTGVLTRNSVMHGIFIGTPTTSWTEIPLPGVTCYHAICTLLDGVPPDPLTMPTLEFLGIATDTDGYLYFWLYRDIFSDVLKNNTWVRQGQIDTTLLPADLTTGIWSAALYGDAITARQNNTTGKLSPLPLISTPN